MKVRIENRRDLQILDVTIFIRHVADFHITILMEPIYFLLNLSELGVFAKRSISKNVQFGPFIANLKLNPENLTGKKFHLVVRGICCSAYNLCAVICYLFIYFINE